jgi:hypothetical protein
MTEREYVEHIRKIAQSYSDALDEILASPGQRHASFERWKTVKEQLSPHTAIALCDAWLAGEGQGATKASEGIS